ncbi:MAG TPA: ABC transporter ATP-binding protein [Methylomirabilota bacterium]
MARIDLINVSATPQSPGKASAAGVPHHLAAMKDMVPIRGGRSSFRIDDLSLTIFDGETLVILGPSGCGKTTLLRIIAGLLPTSSGEVRYDGVKVNDVPPGDRRIGMVFQNYALYPHMTSRTNVLSYFFFRKKTPELDAMAREKYRRTSELMGVELEHLLDRRPTTLSGGEKQRVAVGRCITRDPGLFLLDEPFSNLDQALREKYRVNLKTLLRQFNVSTVYVTHDHVEALILADRLAIMNQGRIEQVGTYEEIYRRPRNAFVAGFLNRHVGTPPISFVDARYVTPARDMGDVRVGIRPEDVEVSVTERPGGIAGTVAETLRLPMMNATMLGIHVDEHEVHAQAAGTAPLRAGDRVWLTFKRYHLFDKTSGTRLRSYPEPGDG